MLNQILESAKPSPDIAYAAGFFDGEGCVYIAKEKTWYKLHIQASQNVRDPLDFLQDLFGGTVTLHKQTKGGEIYSWRLSGSKASEALKKMLPYFFVKQHQAYVAINFQSRQSINRKRTPQDISFQELSYRSLRLLKKRPDLNLPTI